MEAERPPNNSSHRPNHRHARRGRGLSDTRRGGTLQRPPYDEQDPTRQSQRPEPTVTSNDLATITPTPVTNVTGRGQREDTRQQSSRRNHNHHHHYNQSNNRPRDGATNSRWNPRYRNQNSSQRSQENWTRHDRSNINSLSMATAGATAEVPSESVASSSVLTEVQSKENSKPSTSHNFMSFRHRRQLGLKQVSDDGDPESQRKKFEELLRQGKYDCMICCEEIQATDRIWTCYQSCFNMFHLKCIGTWAGSDFKAVVTGASGADAATTQTNKPGWRCPACQNVFNAIPNKYYCFCGKVKDPSMTSSSTPHSCGQICYKRKNGINSKCPHRCQLNCHPGPCPPCEVSSTVECTCGRTSKKVPCGSIGPIFVNCTYKCDKLLDCKQHTCDRQCHPDACDVCTAQVTIKCHCGRSNKQIICSSQAEATFACGLTCNKRLPCGSHRCKKPCHADSCGECERQPNLLKTCACGKTNIKNFTTITRTSCKDPIPSCGKICEFKLNCGPLNDPHKCTKICHEGPHAPCKLKTSYKCNCACNTETVECTKLKERTFICNRRCNKKLSCGRHKCSKACCKNNAHICHSICDKKLSCNRHKCPEVCHTGNCPPCWNVSWEELTCHCGHTVKYPPIQCGDTIPVCDQPCKRQHDCNHPVNHTCHSDNECPPCTQLTYRPCYGGHDMVPNVACCVKKISCGRPCKKMLSCGIHTCTIPCHDGNCNECRNYCSKPRTCGHPCNEVCHEKTSTKCPDTLCKIAMPVHCPCKRLTGKMICAEVNKHKITMTMLARLGIIKEDESLSVDELLKKTEEHKFARLECDEKCAQIERNRALANALNIEEADINPELIPKYPESLKQAYLHYPDFVKDIYETLVALAAKAEVKSNKTAAHNFPSMRSDLRSIIHDLAEYMGMKSQSIDKEPNRSVSVKAVANKCNIPSISIMDAMSLRKNLKSDPSKKIVPLPVAPMKAEVKKPAIDYFDYDGSD